MRKELIAKKKKILKRISIKEYRKLLTFVEKVYLAEYPLKILLARKGSNLFSSLIELVKEEDGGRVSRLYKEKFSEGKEPIIISDRALSYYEQSIRDGRYSNILLVDDTIRHGRTVFRLYSKIKELLGVHSSNIDVWVYAANIKDMIEEPCIKNARIEQTVTLHEWSALTDMIVDIFYLAGQPYTSYIPNIKLKDDAELYKTVEKFVKHPDVCVLSDESHGYLNLHSYAWIEPKTLNFSLFQSIRFYVDEDLKQCVVVPMISLMPIREETLLKYGEILKKFILTDYYGEVFLIHKELSYRMIIYVISSLWSRLFFQKYLEYMNMNEDLENPLEEEMNFGRQILNREMLHKLSKEEVMDIMESLQKVYMEVDMQTLLHLDPDIELLEQEWRRLLEENSETDISNIIQHFLSINGDLDEQKWKQGKKNAESLKRLSGYPLLCIANQLKEKTAEIRGGYEQILKAIDYGRGSIVAKAYETESGVYFVSLLHAGERNYKYKEMRYFPFLYGLFEIERMAGEKGEDAISYKLLFKQKFMERFGKGLDEKAARYDEKDLQELCDTDVTMTYKSVLLRDAWYYPEKKDMDFSIRLADKIMGIKDCIN